ncbi:1-phosphatidylinositol 4,5-bisphosphate phosphodiesterase beta-4-like [Danio aesculapii]|uniref:1-phosphatidylinositol 4,5-bisphosphate phosphodiesterase beta-4-like n=1 Tax=Danio aesculapii TaxID=1142201 RepID=UPI0024BF8698|nr:1-phosphatidylinositol 4,5-bisphosphate phosphodiesterase beta-4-like [Danio aesculapii]
MMMKPQKDSDRPRENMPIASKEDASVLTPQLTIDDLKQTKTFLKLIKKQQKEVNVLKKKHAKAHTALRSSHSAQLDRTVAQHEKEKHTLEKQLHKNTSRKVSSSLEMSRDIEQQMKTAAMNHKSKVKDMASAQASECSEMLRWHSAEEQTVVEQHLLQQCEQLHKLLMLEQEQQTHQLTLLHERQSKEMRTNQAKTSMESSKAISQDKSIKNKAERERRVRELNSTNTRKFLTERKRLAVKQTKECEQLQAAQREQLERLEKHNEELSNSCYAKSHCQGQIEAVCGDTREDEPLTGQTHTSLQ